MLTFFNRRMLLPCAFGVALCFGNAAQAASSMQLDDFHSHCDIRQLNLSSEQISSLRRIRADYKKASDKAYRKADRTNKTRRQNIIKILTQDNFDQNSARDYVESRYISSMDFAVDELAIQHRFYRLLNPRQRQQWLGSCLK